MLNTPSQPKIGARWAGPVSVARLWTARLTLASRLAGIHKEAWIPAAIVVGGLRAFGFSLGALVVANLAAWLAWQWRQAGAYRRNAEDTMLARFRYGWTLEELADPGTVPRLVAVTIERATRAEARAYRKLQGRHTLGAHAMTLVVRPSVDQLAKNWMATWGERTQVRFGFQTMTDPKVADLDANARTVTFGQERVPTRVRAVVS